MTATGAGPSRPAEKSYEREVRAFVLGGFAFLLVLALLSLLAFRKASAWGIVETRARLVSESRAIGDSLSGQVSRGSQLATGGRCAAFLVRFRTLGAAVYGKDGFQKSEAGFLPAAGRSPGRLPLDQRPEGAGPTIVSSGEDDGEAVVSLLLVSGETLRLVWNAPQIRAARRAERILSLVVPAGGAALLLLLVPFLRRLMRPLRALAEAARGAGGVVPASPSAADDEAEEAVTIFRRTIEELRLRTSELEEMRRREKERADVLAVTARTLVGSHPGGVLVVDDSGRLTEANEPARRLLGLAEDAVGRRAAEALEAWPALCGAVERAARGEPTSGEESPAGDDTASGAPAVGITAAPVSGPEGRRLGTLLFLEDRTTTRRLERELSRRRELAALGEMSAGIAHEFRNSTATLLGWARLASSRAAGEGRERALAGVTSEAEHVARVTGDFLLFARPERLAPARFDLARLVAEVVDEERMAGERGPSFEIEGGPVEVDADAALVRRALVNLVRNARESGATRVLVRAARVEGKGAEVVVEDDGPGLPEDLPPERLFIPFATTKESGTGLGLALARKIAALHGGAVDAGPSERLGGALFRLRLP